MDSARRGVHANRFSILVENSRTGLYFSHLSSILTSTSVVLVSDSRVCLLVTSDQTQVADLNVPALRKFLILILESWLNLQLNVLVSMNIETRYTPTMWHACCEHGCYRTDHVLTLKLSQIVFHVKMPANKNNRRALDEQFCVTANLTWHLILDRS